MARIVPGDNLCAFFGIEDDTFERFNTRNIELGRNNIAIGRNGESLFIKELMSFDNQFKIISSNEEGETGSSVDVVLSYLNGVNVNVQIKTTEFPVILSGSSSKKVVKYRLTRKCEKSWKTNLRYNEVDFFALVCLNPQKIWIVPAQETNRNINIGLYSLDNKYVKYDSNFNSLKAFSFGIS